MEPATVPIGNTGFAGTMEAAGIEPANDSYRPGFVYAIRDEQGRAKIGYALDPYRRLAQNQIGNADELSLIGTIPGSKRTEREIHELLLGDRIRGEWYWETGDLRRLFA